jgi:hypothetical protein
MSDETPSNDKPCTPGQQFVIPGTPEVACGEDADLQNCVHCGASLSSNSEFCQVCSSAVSGGHLPPDHDHERKSGDKSA